MKIGKPHVSKNPEIWISLCLVFWGLQMFFRIHFAVIDINQLGAWLAGVAVGCICFITIGWQAHKIHMRRNKRGCCRTTANKAIRKS